MHIIAPIDRVLARAEVCKLTSLSPTVVRQLELDGLFPKRFSLGPRRVGWLASEINAWLEARAAERFEPKADAEAKARRTPALWARVADVSEGTRGEG